MEEPLPGGTRGPTPPRRETRTEGYRSASGRGAGESFPNTPHRVGARNPKSRQRDTSTQGLPSCKTPDQTLPRVHLSFSGSDGRDGAPIVCGNELLEVSLPPQKLPVLVRRHQVHVLHYEKEFVDVSSHHTDSRPGLFQPPTRSDSPRTLLPTVTRRPPTTVSGSGQTPKGRTGPGRGSKGSGAPESRGTY